MAVVGGSISFCTVYKTVYLPGGPTPQKERRKNTPISLFQDDVIWFKIRLSKLLFRTIIDIVLLTVKPCA